MSALLGLAERLADLPLAGEDSRKADYIIEQAFTARADTGALEIAAGDLLRRWDRSV